MLDEHKYLKVVCLVTLIIFLITIIPIGIFVGIVQYDKWQAAKVIEQVINYRENNNMMLAIDKIQKLADNQPNNAEVQKELARTLLAIWKIEKSPETLQRIFKAWQNLEINGQMLRQDRWEYADMAIETGNPYLARDILLRATNQDSVEYLLLQQRISYLLENYDEVRLLGEKAYRIKPDDPDTQLNYAKSLLATGKSQDRETAITILKKLQNRSDVTGLQTLQTICTTPELSSAMRLEASDLLIKHPDGDLQTFLVATEAKINLSPQESARLFQEVIDSFAASTVDDKVIIGRWLNRMRAFRYTLSLIDEISSQTNTDLFLIRADALAEEGQWAEIERLMNSKGVPLQTFHTQVFLGIALAAQDRHSEASAVWSKALSPGADLEYRLHYLAKHTAGRRYYDHAEGIFRKMIQNPKTIEAGYTGLINSWRQQNKPEKILETLYEMKEKFPNDDRIYNDINYYKILTENDLNKSTQAAYKLYESNKRMLAFRVTLALGLLKTDDSDSAFNLLNIKDLNWNDRYPYAKLVKACTLLANNQKQAGEALYANIGEGQLMELENELYRLFSTK